PLLDAGPDEGRRDGEEEGGSRPHQPGEGVGRKGHGSATWVVLRNARGPGRMLTADRFTPYAPRSTGAVMRRRRTASRRRRARRGSRGGTSRARGGRGAAGAPSAPPRASGSPSGCCTARRRPRGSPTRRGHPGSWGGRGRG